MDQLADQAGGEGWRVKLYELESTGNWIDLGVGYVIVQIVTELGGPALCIASELEIGKYILVSKIQSEDLYEKQGGEFVLQLRLIFVFFLLLTTLVRSQHLLIQKPSSYGKNTVRHVTLTTR